MSEQTTSSPSENRSTGRFLRNVILKALALLIIISLGFAWMSPLRALGDISFYNRIFPGRLRLPFGEDYEKSYNISILQLNAMFASHEINAGDKPENEFRVLILGDSSVWGFLLSPEQTLSARLNSSELTTLNGRPLRFFNLGYPTMSVLKDFLLLDYAQRYKPDLVLWFVTLESLPVQKQLESPLVQYNPVPARDLISEFRLGIDLNDQRFIDRTFWDRTLPGQRRTLADLIRLQLLGVMWAGTGIDHDVPLTYEPPQVELSDDVTFQGFQPDQLSSDDLSFDVLEAGILLADSTPVLIVNQPILIATGPNSDVRYNAYYPRWAYDAYREMMAMEASKQDWTYLDLWDAVPAQKFTDNAIHTSPEGVELVVDQMSETILHIADTVP
jgi:hypothetical protein